MKRLGTWHCPNGVVKSGRPVGCVSASISMHSDTAVTAGPKTDTTRKSMNSRRCSGGTHEYTVPTFSSLRIKIGKNPVCTTACTCCTIVCTQ